MERLASLAPLAHNLFRAVFGFTFFTHGAQKLLGWFGGDAIADYTSILGLAGFIECVAGFLIMVGFQTRVAAFVAAGEMAVAYLWRHTGGSGSLWHWENRGELALLYCFGFLLLSTLGSGAWSLDALRTRRA